MVEVDCKCVHINQIINIHKFFIVQFYYQSHAFTELENWGCGEETEFSAPNGVLTSHDWPNNYTNNLDCEYTISVGEDSGSLVMISFTHFDVEYESECDYDYVEVKQLNFYYINNDRKYNVARI